MPRRSPGGADAGSPDLSDAIVAVALAQAERDGWEGLRLNRVADALSIPLSTVYGHFRDVDAVAEAWLSRADRAMLAVPGTPGYGELPVPERLERAIMAWLGVLAPHRRVARQILLGKLYPGHPHFVAALAVRLSRTVQWLREAARLNAPPPRRQIEEIGLTWLFVATVALWTADASEGQDRTRRFLARRLAEADRLMRRSCLIHGQPARADRPRAPRR